MWNLSSLTRDRTRTWRVRYPGRLNCWTTREVPMVFFIPILQMRKLGLGRGSVCDLLCDLPDSASASLSFSSLSRFPSSSHTASGMFPFHSPHAPTLPLCSCCSCCQACSSPRFLQESLLGFVHTLCSDVNPLGGTFPALPF